MSDRVSVCERVCERVGVCKRERERERERLNFKLHEKERSGRRESVDRRRKYGEIVIGK